MQDPNADTEWNDALRKYGILPEKEKEVEITEEQLLKMVEDTIKEKSGKKDIEVSQMLANLLFDWLKIRS